MAIVKWSDIPDTLKTVGMVFAMVASSFAWMYSHFETAEASQEKWTSHNMQIACNKIFDIMKQVRALERERDSAPTDARRAEINEDIKWLRERIKDIDPTGVCSA